MERPNDVLPLVYRDKAGAVKHYSPSGPNQSPEIEECGGDGFFMARLCRARDTNHWSASDRSQMMQMNNTQYKAYEAAIDEDHTIADIRYANGPGKRSVQQIDAAGTKAWQPSSKLPAGSNVESMRFRSVSRLMFERQPVQMGLRMLQADFSHNRPLGYYTAALNAINDMLKDEYPVASGDVARTLKDYVDRMCVAGQLRGEQRGARLEPDDRIQWSKGKPAYKFVERAGLTPAEKRESINAQSHRKDGKPYVQDDLAIGLDGKPQLHPDGRAVRNDDRGIQQSRRGPAEAVPPEKEQGINITDFGEELMNWSHWVMLDDSVANQLNDQNKAVDAPGTLPRGSCFVRYVDWKDQYYKYPQVPIMRPEACGSLLLWEAYLTRFRDYQLAHGPYQRKTKNTPFDLDEFLNIMYSEASDATALIPPGANGYASRWECCLPEGWNPREWYQTEKDHAAMRAGGTEIAGGIVTGLWSPNDLYTKLQSDPELASKADELSINYPELFGKNNDVKYSMGSLPVNSKWRRAPHNGKTLAADANKPLKALFRDDVLDTDQKMAMIRFFGRLSNAARTSWRYDGAAGPTDYLYVIVLCSGDGASQFGKSILEGVNKLAEGLGVRRVVLSALPTVVGYYHRFLDYNLITRSGRSLEYLQNRPAEAARGGPYRIQAKYIPIDTSSPEALRKSAEERKAAKDAFKRDLPESAGLDVFTSRQLELPDLHDPNLCVGDSDVIHGTKVENPPVPYYYAHAFFDVVKATAAAAAAAPAAAAVRPRSITPPGARRRQKSAYGGSGGP